MKALLIILASAALLLASCGGMTDREKAMAGKYYISALSDTHPVIELNDKNRSVLRAIRPGELSFSVEGTWHVEGDSLIIVNDSTSITIEEGDPALVGSIAPRVAYPILRADETMMRIERSGVIYDYQRRPE